MAEDEPTRPPKDEPKRCRCGYSRGHYMVAEERQYGSGGWISLLFGISAKPRRILHRCTICKEVVAED